MQVLETYIGIEPFTVPVDSSQRLEELAVRARLLRGLPFEDKLRATKALVHEAFPINAYEEMVTTQDEKARDIVLSKHPLSDALKIGQACCRYQGALFFVLGHEADLGDKHFIQAAPVNQRVNTVFNELVDDSGKRRVVSIFTESLKDKGHDYSVQNPRVFEQAFSRVTGYKMYSYHRTPRGLVLVANATEHIFNLD